MWFGFASTKRVLVQNNKRLDKTIQ